MPNQYAMMESVLIGRGYTTPHSMMWYKYNQNVKGTDRYTFATELGIIGYYPNRAEASSWLMDNNPMKRRNVKIGPTVKNYWKRDGKDEPLNSYEKPGWIEGEIAAEHLQPGSVVVIPGAGSGGSLVGLLNKGFNIYAFENDPDQWAGLLQRLHALAENCDSARSQDDVAVISDYEVNCVAPNPRLDTMNLITQLKEAKASAADAMTEVKELQDELEEEKDKIVDLEKKLKDSEVLSQKVNELQKETSGLVKPQKEVPAQAPLPSSPTANVVPAAVADPSPAKEPEKKPEGEQPAAEKK
jgi:hypothetical protein